ncbi:hypothetical protein [Secundilactobacillus odoratitofui]|nr:hypothetical protein [Secundilactobacillus odoratitofui]
MTIYAATLKRDKGKYFNKLELSARILICSGAAITIVLMVMRQISL